MSRSFLGQGQLTRDAHRLRWCPGSHPGGLRRPRRRPCRTYPSAEPGRSKPRCTGRRYTREGLKFPETLRTHTLANMRDHLLALAEIQDQLARGAYDKASEIAEQRLGMSLLGLHGAHDVAKFMPQGMQAAGTALHRSASQFAIVAKDASVTGDLKGSLAALARVSQTCVACHAAYRIK